MPGLDARELDDEAERAGELELADRLLLPEPDDEPERPRRRPVGFPSIPTVEPTPVDSPVAVGDVL